MAEGFKLFTNVTHTADDVNDYLMRQAVMRFATEAARDSALALYLTEGLLAGTADKNRLWRYSGTAWELVSGSMPRVSTYKAAVQSISNGTNTVCLWDTEDYDTDALHSTSSNTGRITIPAGLGGVWQVSFAVAFAAVADGATAAAWLEVNSTGSGRRYAQSVVGSSGAAITPSLTGAVSLVLAAADYVNVVAFQNAGGAVNVNGGTGSGLTATYLGPA